MEALWVACVFQLCNCILPLYLQRFSFYKALKSNQRKEFSERVLSTCFACLVVPLAVCCLVSSFIYSSPDHTTSRFLLRATATLALGYFLWDLFICCRYYEEYGAPFLLHAVLCTITYYIVAVEEQMMVYGVSALLYEISTPFLNARWLLLKMGYKRRESLWQWSNTLFAISFLVVRIGFGSVLTYSIVNYCWVSTQESIVVRLFSTLNIVASYGLNVYWGRTVVKNIIKHYRTP